MLKMGPLERSSYSSRPRVRPMTSAAFAMLAVDRMHPRTFVFIMLLALCHPLLRGQMLTNALPPQPQQNAIASGGSADAAKRNAPLPDDPEEEVIPVAQPEPPPADG